MSEESPKMLALTETTVALKFLAGEFCLFVVRTRVQRAARCFLDPLPSDFSPETLVSALPRGVQALLLPCVPADGLQPGVTLSRNSIRYVPAVVSHHFIELSDSYEAYLKTNFTAKSRHNITRTVRKFEELCGGNLDFRVFRTPDEVRAFYVQASQLSVMTYQHRLLGVGLPQTPEFLESLLKLAEQDRVRDYALFCQDRMVAYAHCVAQADILFYSTIGYDPDLGRWSPGTVLLFLILKQVFAEGRFRVFDFGYGASQSKSLFSNRSRLSADIYYFRWGLKNVFVVFAHTGLDRLSGRAGALAARLGIKEQVRKFLRKAI